LSVCNVETALHYSSMPEQSPLHCVMALQDNGNDDM
jgi:hypothetical protein